jgi:8-oxo-dGTP pyrophosphatase MutT (NUDIX family)
VTPAMPRLSSTIILVRERAGLEVLMVVRNTESYFASALVFPGGTVDPEDRDPAWADCVTGDDGLSEDERAIRIAGFREVFEETGLLLADGPVEPGDGSFCAMLAASGARIDLSAMHPFAHWITPEISPKRYDTHFRLCGLTTELTAVSDGRETVSVEWLRPRDALALGATGERKILFPTRLNLELLSQSTTVEEAIAAAQRRKIVTVSPRIERRPEGAFLTVPHDAGYGPAEELTPGSREARAEGRSADPGLAAPSPTRLRRT